MAEAEMRKNALTKLLAEGRRGLNGWIAIPNTLSAEIYAAQGWDSVTIDMQHGGPDISDVIPLLQAICQSNVTPLVRVPWNEPSHIMRILDAGAYGIICPMVNSKAEAEELVSAGRYPPLGVRSAGPFRALQYAGADYIERANEEILLLAMIETRQALHNLDSILSVQGLDGVYVGPSDLALSLGKPATLDPTNEEVREAIATIARKTRAKGLITGVHTDGPRTAAKRYAEGYQFCTLFNDLRLLAMAAQQVVREARGQAAAAQEKTY
jgi:4-hydroxy-2-oxoheptanedioate aldolase